MLFTLFLPPAYGSADNSTLSGIIFGNGLYPSDGFRSGEYKGYAELLYGVDQYYREAPLPLSSQTVFIQAAKALSFLLSPDKTVFDIRFYAFLLCIVQLFAIWLLADFFAERLPGAGGYAAAGLLVLFFSDSAYLSWFNSFYQESVILPFFLLFAATLLQMGSGRRGMKKLFFLNFLSGMVLITVKPGLSPSGLLLGIVYFLLFFICFRTKRLPERFYRFTGAQQRLFFAACIAASISFCVTGAALHLAEGPYGRAEQYHSMSKGMMKHADDPKDAAAFFGIDPAYALLDNTSAYEQNPLIAPDDELLSENFYPHYNAVSAGLYYLAHPLSFLEMLEAASEQSYTPHIYTGGSFTPDAGHGAGESGGFLTLHGSLKETYLPTRLGFLFLWTLFFWFLYRKQSFVRGVLLALILMGLCRMAAVVLYEGAFETARQMFFYNIAFDLLTLCVLARIFGFVFDKAGSLLSAFIAVRGKAREKTRAEGSAA